MLNPVTLVVVALRAKGQEIPQTRVAQVESEPGEYAEDYREQEPRVLRAHLRRGCATQIAGDEDATEYGGSGDQHQDCRREQSQSDRCRKRSRVPELRHALDVRREARHSRAAIDEQKQADKPGDAPIPSGRRPGSSPSEARR